MLLLPGLAGKTVAVAGLGQSGRSVCRALIESGARVLAWDDSEAARAAAGRDGIPLTDLASCDFETIDRLVLSPGIPLHHPAPHPLVLRARTARRPVVGDIELLVESLPNRKVLGITGTNGKSTTAALTAELLQAAGLNVQLGGNIGLPALDLLPTPPDCIYVLELSSFQLDLTETLACHVAVVLNLSPDHLDRHGDMAGYAQAKRRILRNQKASAWAIIGVDDDHGVALCDDLRRRADRHVVAISGGRAVSPGVFVQEGHLVDALDGEPVPVLDLRPFATLRGDHNGQNAAAAYAVARALGLEPATACKGFATFKGLPHRLELVAKVRGVSFVNDSKATNPAAAVRALSSFRQVFWIAGGRAKPGGFAALDSALARVAQAFLIGDAASALARYLEGRVPYTLSGDLDAAVAEAFDAATTSAEPGPVVLLAPACASFDQFRNFEARGEAFRAAVARIQASAPLLGDRG